MTIYDYRWLSVWHNLSIHYPVEGGFIIDAQIISSFQKTVGSVRSDLDDIRVFEILHIFSSGLRNTSQTGKEPKEQDDATCKPHCFDFFVSGQDDTQIRTRFTAIVLEPDPSKPADQLTV